jgi:hypothetical protein
MLLSHVKRGHAAFAVQTQVIGVVAAVGVLAEDVAAERGLDRVVVVGVAHLAQEAVLGAGSLDVSRHGLHFVEGGRRRGHQVRVVDQGDVFRRLRHAVDLAVGEGEGLHRVRGKVGGIRAKLDRGQQTAGVQLADPVMRAQDDVRAAARRRGGDEVTADVADGLLHHDQADASLLRERFAQGFQDRRALFVGPDGQADAGVGGGFSSRGFRGRGGFFGGRLRGRSFGGRGFGGGGFRGFFRGRGGRGGRRRSSRRTACRQNHAGDHQHRKHEQKFVAHTNYLLLMRLV